MHVNPEESFLQDCLKHFKATVDVVDFSQSEVARNQINSWVSQKTENKIKDPIPPGALNSFTMMVLVNAVYFKGTWNSPFAEEQIMEFRNGKERFMTKMICQFAMSFRFCHMPDKMLKALEMPYQGNNFSMLILLPTTVDGIENMEKNLTESLLKNVVRNLRGGPVKVCIPKFRLESSFRMKHSLSALGMPSAFDKNKADFTGMGRSRDLCISDAYHKAFVEVDEYGTEAAAAEIFVYDIPRSDNYSPPDEFWADHPFLFFIRDSVNDVILFAGRFYKPVEEPSN
jgi:serpin B